MATIIFGAAITLGVFIIMILVFRHRGEQTNASHTGTYFSTYDGGHDGLGQSGSGGAGGGDDGGDAGGGE